MKQLWRIIDANINRVSEGLRVVEDLTRFVDHNKALSKEIRNLRHQVRKGIDKKYIMQSRNVKTDIGLLISQTTDCDQKNTIKQLKLANMKRVQEGLRSIEETLKLLNAYTEAKIYEQLRYKSYTLESKLHREKYTHEDIYLILGEEFSKGRLNLEVASIALEAGVKIIQYREKYKSKSLQYEECFQLLELMRSYDAKLIINDHIDIALAVGAHGVHLGQDDLGINHARKIAPHLIIGISTHDIEQALKAEQNGADYIGVGPMFKTSTKKNLEASLGLEFLEEVSRSIKIPYVAIGGLKQQHVKQISSLGASCAMISEIVGAKDIYQKIENIKGEISS